MNQLPTHYKCFNPVKLTTGKAVMFNDVITADEYKSVRAGDKKWFVPTEPPEVIMPTLFNK